MNLEFIKEVGVVRWLIRWPNHLFVKRVLRRSRDFTTPAGTILTLPPESRFGSEVYVTNGNVDWGSERLLYKLLRGKGAFLDIGANIGYYSVYMCRRAERVYAFEPDPRALAIVESNAARYQNISVVRKAISDTIGKCRFVIEGSTELSHLSKGSDAAGVDVETTTVDAFAAENQLTIDAIKIDAEGMDVRVIAGAKNVLRRDRCIVLTEASLSPELSLIVEEIDYTICGYVKGHGGFQFRELERGSSCKTKMLFLIPRERCAEVFSYADQSKIYVQTGGS